VPSIQTPDRATATSHHGRPTLRLGQTPADLNDVAHSSLTKHANRLGVLRGDNRVDGQAPSELPSVPMLSATSPSGIFDSKVSRTRFCADRCVLLVRRQEYPGRGPRGARGWPPPGQHGQAVPPSSYKTRAKIMYEQKTRGGAGGIFVFRFVAAAGNAHDF